MTTKSFIASLAFFAVAVFGNVLPATAQTPTSGCGDYFQAGTAIPSGYGAAYNPFLGGKDIDADCPSGDAVTVGTGSNLEYVYKDGYVYLNNSWQKVSLSSPGSLISGSWYSGSGKITLPSGDYSNWTYIAAYTCTYANGSWKCGCADNVCTTPHWQLQAIRIPPAPAPTPTPIQGGTNTVSLDMLRTNPTIQAKVGDVVTFDGNANFRVRITSIDKTSVVTDQSRPTAFACTTTYPNCNYTIARVKAVALGTAKVSIDVIPSNVGTTGVPNPTPAIIGYTVTVVVGGGAGSGGGTVCPAYALACPAGQHDQVGTNCSHTCVGSGTSTGGGSACPAVAKLCPDGKTYVTPSGPSCIFQCPSGSSGTASSTVLSNTTTG